MMEQRAYSYEELGGLKDQIVEICRQVARDNPTAWREAHNGNFDETSTRYNDLCVQELRKHGIYAGCNGKRGGDQRSDDVLAFGLSDGRGAQDRSGRFQSMAIIDYIGDAGGPNPSVGWGDVSQAAPGRFLDPQGLPRVDGGGSQPQPPTPQPGPSPQPQPTPAPGVDLSGVLQRLEAIERAVSERPSIGDIDQKINEALRADDIMGFIRVTLNKIEQKPTGGGGCVLRRGGPSGDVREQILRIATADDPEQPDSK